MRPIDDIFAVAGAERARQFDLPGTEHDVNKGPNDWIATLMPILGESCSRAGIPPTAEDFERSMVKVIAVAVAAIQHAELMQSKNRLG